MRTDFLFQLLDCVGPVDRLGRLIVIGDILAESGFEGICRDKVIRLQMFALQQTEPDFDLIQPGRVGRQPVHLKVQPPFTRLLLLTEPPLELFGRMGDAIVRDEDHRVDLSSQGLGNDFLVYKGLEIDEALALTAGPVDLAIRHRKSGKQMACTTTMIASFVERRLAWACWARKLLPFSCLDRGFLIETDQPGACSQERSRLAIGL